MGLSLDQRSGAILQIITSALILCLFLSAQRGSNVPSNSTRNGLYFVIATALLLSLMIATCIEQGHSKCSSLTKMASIVGVLCILLSWPIMHFESGDEWHTILLWVGIVLYLGAQWHRLYTNRQHAPAKTLILVEIIWVFVIALLWNISQKKRWRDNHSFMILLNFLYGMLFVFTAGVTCSLCHIERD